MQTYFDQVDVPYIANMAEQCNPDYLARTAASYPMYPVTQTTFALASIRARGNWMLVNGQWHKRV